MAEPQSPPAYDPARSSSNLSRSARAPPPTKVSSNVHSYTHLLRKELFLALTILRKLQSIGRTSKKQGREATLQAQSFQRAEPSSSSNLANVGLCFCPGSFFTGTRFVAGTTPMFAREAAFTALVTSNRFFFFLAIPAILP